MKYVNEVQGYNSRLDPIQAAVLRVKLQVLETWNARRADIAARYTVGLSGTGLVLPAVPPWADPAWHLYVVRHPQRNRLQKTMREAGIDTLIHYPIPPHLQRAYADARYVEGRFPIIERMAKQLLSLPMGPQLNDASVDAVIAALTAAAKT